MPSAFEVANSPLTSNGTIAVTGAGTVAQYVRGDGSLADFPESIGSGASVSYYLNGSVNQGTIGGVTYYEMNKTPIIGAGTDFTRNSNGYIASFLTDANDPALLVIPAGNWNFETYFEASSGGGSPTFYLELYKYDGTTFSLIASNSGSPKLINDGTSIEAYFSALAVPQTTLTLTDRLAIRIYVTTAGRTITLHTENGHLCQVITTFTTGLSALNGLTSQVQFFAVGTSGTNFNIASATDTHTFNLPTASATNRGALASADWSTFNNKQNQLNGTGFVKASGTTITYDNSTYQVTSEKGQPNGYASLDSNGKVPLTQINDALIGNVNYQGLWNASTNNPTLVNPPASGTKGYYYIVSTAGTFAGISFEVGDWIISNGSAWQKVDNTDAVSSVFGRTGNVTASNGDYNTSQVTENTNLYYTEARVSANTDVAANTAARHAAVTLGTANGLSLSTQQLSLQLATSGQNGALSSTDWTTFNNKENAITAGTTAQYFRGDKTFQTLNTAAVPESGNLYFTNARAIASVLTGYTSGAGTISAADTILSAIQKLNGNIGALVTGVSSVNGQTGAVTLTTSNIAEGTNLYFTQARVSANTDVAANTAARHAAVTLGTANGLSLSTQQLSLGLASAGVTGALSGTDWSTFNSKQQALNGTGFVKISGTTISYDNSTYLTTAAAASTYVPYTGATSGVDLGTYTLSASNLIANGGFNAGALLLKQSSNAQTIFLGYTAITPVGNNTLNFGFSTGSGVWKNFTLSSFLLTDNINRTYTLPDASGTIALVGGSGVGTVTSVAALTLGTSGTDLSSSVANGTTTPVITLNVPTASAANRGALSAADWTTFNNKQNALTNPVTGTGTTNYLPKFTGTSTIGNSAIIDNGTSIEAISRTFIVNRGSHSAFGFEIDQQSTFAFGSTNGKRVAIIRDSTLADNGLQFGYDTVDKTGIIAGSATSSGTGLDFYTFNGSSWGSRTRLTSSGNLLVGTTTDSGFKLDVNGTGRFSGTLRVVANGQALNLNSLNTNGNYLEFSTSVANTGYIGNASQLFASPFNSNADFGIYASGNLYISTGGGTPRLILNSSGNLGLGVTPSAWGLRGFDISNGSLFGDTNNVGLTQNAYYGSSWVYKNNGTAANYIVVGNEHRWNIAPSGTAGNAISFTQAMTLDASGRLGIGVTNMSSYNAGGNHFVIGGGEFRGLTIAATTEGNIYFADGTTGADSYRGTIGYNHTSNYLYFFSDGSERMRITSGGNVLIGTTTDAGFKLDVNGTGRFSGALLVSNNDITQTGTRPILSLQQSGTTKAFWGISDGVDDLVNGASSGDAVFRKPASSGAFRWTVDGGSTSALVIASTGAATFSSSVTIQNGNSLTLLQSGNANGSLIRSVTNGDFRITTGGTTDAFTITNGGNVGIGCIAITKFQVQSNTNRRFFVGDTGSQVQIGGLLDNGSDYTPVAIDGTRLLLNSFSGGNVLIGTTSDNSNRLRVNGSIWADGAATLNGNFRIINSNGFNDSVNFDRTAINAMTLNSSGNLILNGTTGSSRITCYGDGYFSGGIQTGNPYGSTSANWLLGRFLTETTSANGSIRVQIGSKYYNIAAEDLGEVPT
jgi:hypothetical protein